jgi:hypothetical protein
MMVRERDAALGELPEVRRGFGGDEVGSHAVPDDHDDATIFGAEGGDTQGEPEQEMGNGLEFHEKEAGKCSYRKSPPQINAEDVKPIKEVRSSEFRTGQKP